jgi:putative peptide zinc metalloprotease protein
MHLSVPTSDPFDARPVLRPDLQVRAVGRGNHLRMRLTDAGQHASHELGLREYEFASLLDGTRTLGDALAAFSQTRPTTAFSRPEALRVCQWLATAGLLVEGSLTESASASPHSLNLFSLRWPLVTGPHWAARLEPVLGWLFHPAGVVVWLATVLTALLLGFPQRGRLNTTIADWFVPSNWLGLALLWTGLKILHEAGHAVAASRAGTPPREAGVLIQFLAPLAYVDLSATWRLASRTQRLVTALAGLYVELFVAAMALIGWSLTTNPQWGWWLGQVVLLAGVNSVLFNLNPLARMDGYFVLSDLWGEPNLGPRGRADLTRRIARILFGRHSNTWLGPARESFPIVAFAFASLLWSCALLITIFTALAASLQGGGLALVLIGLALTLGPTLIRTVQWSRDTVFRAPTALGRAMAITLATSLVATLGLRCVNNPFDRQVPCIVEFQDGQALRSPEDAFVDQWLIDSGETVQAGDPLVILRSESLLRDRAEAAARLAQSELREHLALERGDLGVAKVFRREAAAGASHLAQLDSRLASLTLRAPRSGVVVAATLAERVGTLVPIGTELLLIGDPARKQLTALIPETELARLPLKGAPLPFRLLSMSQGTTQYGSLQPRAGTVLDYPALGAPLGGQLAVKRTESQGESPGWQLATAHARLECPLDGDTSRRLHLGETGTLSLGPSGRSLAAVSKDLAHRWLATLAPDTTKTR